MAREPRCPDCGHENPPANRFCGACGAALARTCAACGQPNPPDHRFCGACGAPLLEPAARRSAETRKVVTVVFADLIGSTSLHERLDAESTRRFMDRYYRALRAAVEAHGGTVVKLLGDGVLAAFGVPRVAEDDAMRAVRAAVAMQDAFRDLARGQSVAVGAIGLRVGVNTGEVVVAANDDDVVGDPVNVAARLQQEARDGDVLIGESTRRLVEGQVTLATVGVLSLRGRLESVPAHRVVSLERPQRTTTVSFVGRDDELRRIQAVYDAAVAAPAARLAVILGSPGLGKSRLLEEFARRLGERATVVTARCDAAASTTFAPLVEALRSLLGVDAGTSAEALLAAVETALPQDEAENARIAAGVAAFLAGTPAAPEETFYVVRRLLAAHAAVRPVVLAVDDLQWAEPLLFDLTEHLVQWSTDVPLLVLVAARPELREARSSLASHGGLVNDLITLGGLDAGAATRLAANVIGAEELPAAIAGRVLSTSEGNPLFVGELVRMLVHDGALKREGDRWTAGVEVASLEMPPTIHALLAARIERLRPEERTVLERAAVVGRHFSRAAVAHLLAREAADLDSRLEALRRSELIEPDTTWFLGEPGLRFHHVLIRDAAYRSLLKGTRAELHASVADWIESRTGADAVEHDEAVGWHLEQSYQYLRELGPLDEQGRRLGERAARHLGRAGRRALARDDLPLAASLLGRALHLLAEDDETRAELALDWCEALLASGEVRVAAEALTELARFAEGSTSAPRLRAWHTCFLGQRAVLTDPQALRATADAVAAAAEALAECGDIAGEAKAHSVHALALARLGAIGACEAALDRALAAARRAGDRRRSNAVLAGAPPAALWGPSPVTRASGRCLDVVRVLRITQGAPAVEAVALRCQAVLEALRGRAEAARRMIASSRRMVEELGITQRLFEADVFAGLIELLEGDAPAAERFLRGAYDGLRRHGLGIDAAQAGALLGRALLAQGREREAEALSHDSEALAGDDLKAAIAWRGVRAEALAQRGEHAAAIDYARAAVDIAAQTDALLDHADARVALAAALRAAGRDAEAALEEDRAIELWEAKGAVVLADGAHRSAPRRGFDLQRDEKAMPHAGGPDGEQTTLPAATGVTARRDGTPSSRRVHDTSANAVAARMEALVAARDKAALAEEFATLDEVVEHATGSVFGRDAMLEIWNTLLEARAPALRSEPLASLGDLLALRRGWMAFDSLADETMPFGAVTREEILLMEVDEGGRQRRLELFQPNHLGEAICRLYERHAELMPDGPERARAAAISASLAALLGPPDIDRYAGALADDVHAADHRILGFGSTSGVAAMLRAFAALFAATDSFATRVEDVLEARQDGLLIHFRAEGVDRESGGAFDREFLLLWVFGEDGLVIDSEQFDVGSEDAALARFDALAGEQTAMAQFDGGNLAAASSAFEERHGAESSDPRRASLTRAFTGAFAARDWTALAALLAPDLVVTDHRLLGWETLHGPAAYIRALRQLVDLAPDVQLRVDHLTMSGSRFLYGTTWVGTREGGAFETPSVILCELDVNGRMRRFDQYDVDQLDEARRRLFDGDRSAREGQVAARLPAADPLVIPPNAAVRAGERFRQLALWGNWDALRDLIAPECIFEDRRSLFRTSGDRETLVANARAIGRSVWSHATRTLLATAGDTLAVHANHWVGGEASPFQVDALEVTQVDEHGRLLASVIFDSDRRRDASLELMNRYFDGEGSRTVPASIVEMIRAMNDHDLARMRAALPDDFRFRDHRRTGVGDLGTADDYVASLAAVFENSHDMSTDTLYHVAADEHGSLSLGRLFGTWNGGGEFESLFLRLNVYRDGRCMRTELFEPEDLELARARFEELRPQPAAGEGPVGGDEPASAYLVLPKNAASVAGTHVGETLARPDWDERLRALAAPDFVFEDRRRFVLLAGDIDLYIENLRVVRGWRFIRRQLDLVATLGDRIAIERLTAEGDDGGSGVGFAWEFLRLVEVDAEDRLRAVIHFDASDRSAASIEGQRRFAAGEAAGNPAQAVIHRFGEAIGRRDWEALRACCADDLVLHDHRQLSFGSITRDDYIDSLSVLVDLAPDVNGEMIRVLDWNARGRVCVIRQFGNRGDGGAFEMIFVPLILVDGDRVVHFEIFELHDIERARLRFAELCRGDTADDGRGRRGGD